MSLTHMHFYDNNYVTVLVFTINKKKKIRYINIHINQNIISLEDFLPSTKRIAKSTDFIMFIQYTSQFTLNSPLGTNDCFREKLVRKSSSPVRLDLNTSHGRV